MRSTILPFKKMWLSTNLLTGIFQFVHLNLSICSTVSFHLLTSIFQFIYTFSLKKNKCTIRDTSEQIERYRWMAITDYKYPYLSSWFPSLTLSPLCLPSCKVIFFSKLACRDHNRCDVFSSTSSKGLLIRPDRDQSGFPRSTNTLGFKCQVMSSARLL